MRKSSESELSFLSFRSGNRKPIFSTTVSFWLKQTIIDTHENATDQNIQLSGAKARSIWPIADSQVFIREAMDKVMEMGSWQSHNTFTSYYFRDLTLENKQGLHLMPALMGGVQMKV